MGNIYDTNETMRLLGRQDYCALYNREGEAYKGIKEIQQARTSEFVMDAAFDIFALGFIHGKRVERNRNKK